MAFGLWMAPFEFVLLGWFRGGIDEWNCFPCSQLKWQWMSLERESEQATEWTLLHRIWVESESELEELLRVECRAFEPAQPWKRTPFDSMEKED